MADPLEVTVRDARADDLPAIQRIYNREILEGVATWDDWPWSDAQRRAWFEQQRDEVVLVAVGPHSVAGFAYTSPYRGKFGYRFTREVTFYVDLAFQRQGVGQRLLAALIERARARNLHSLVAWIEAGNQASRALVRSFGFEEVGREREAGYKHGRWLDGIDAQLLLQSAEEFERLVAPGFRILTIGTAEQLAEAIEVRRAVFIEEQDVPEDEEIDGYDADPASPGMNERVVHVLGRLDGQPVATARLLLDQAGEPPHGYPHVGRVAVLSELRGRRYGALVMEALHEERGGAATSASRSRRRSTRGRSTNASVMSHAVGCSWTPALSTAGWTSNSRVDDEAAKLSRAPPGTGVLGQWHMSVGTESPCICNNESQLRLEG